MGLILKDAGMETIDRFCPPIDETPLEIVSVSKVRDLAIPKVIFPSEIILSSTELPIVEIDISKGPRDSIEFLKNKIRYDLEKHYWNFEYQIPESFFYKVNKNLIKKPIKVLVYRDLDRKDLIKLYFEGLNKIKDEFKEEILTQFILEINGKVASTEENIKSAKPIPDKKEIHSGNEEKSHIFKDTINHVFRNYFKVNGRTPRRYFWIYQLLSYAVLGIGAIIFLIAVFFELNNFAVLFGQVFLIIWILGIIPIEIGIRIRRLHDINLSAWTLLILLIPLVNFFFLVYFLLAPSHKGPNKYGNEITNDH